MKVILFKDVPRLGKVGDVVNVAAGHFRNYLAPKKLAAEAIPQNLKILQLRKKAMGKVAVRGKNDAEKVAEAFAGLTLKMQLKAGENDRLFGSVTSADLVEKLKEAGYEVDRKKIYLPEPIKSLGEFPIEVKIHPEVTAKVLVIVEKA